MQLSEEEYFMQRAPEIAELPGSARKKAIAELETGDPRTYCDFISALRISRATNEFVRGGSRFDLTASGKINTYSLFAELMSNLNSRIGRVGLICPTGIATDKTNSAFFRSLLLRNQIISLFSFYEVRYWFTQTDDKNSFCLLTLGEANTDPVFVFQANPIADLFDESRRVALSPSSICAMNPNTRTAPVFRSKADATLTARIYAGLPILRLEGEESELAWKATFKQGLFNMTSDSSLFVRSSKLDIEGGSGQGEAGSAARLAAAAQMGIVPVYEAKLMHQYDHRWASFSGKAANALQLSRKLDPAAEIEPRYFVPRENIEESLKDGDWSHSWVIGWRRNARNSDDRTTIASILPRFGVGDSIFLLFAEQSPELLAALLGCLNSLVLDYVARQKLGGVNYSFYFIEQLPVPPPSRYAAKDLAFIVPRVLELTYTSYSLTPFARDVGYSGEPFTWDEDRRALLRAELDAWYARAYGLSRDDLRYVLDPADLLGPDYPSETFRVLKEKEIKQYEEYRTQRLVLAAWDRQTAGLTPESELNRPPIILSPQSEAPDFTLERT
jgi:hypothetical protein